MFSITLEPGKHRVLLDMERGFDHDPRTVLREFKRVVPHVRSDAGLFDVVADFSRARIVPPDHARNGEQMMHWLRHNGLRKCANVLINAAQRMAIVRKTGGDPRFDFFLTHEEAIWWLERDWPRIPRP